MHNRKGLKHSHEVNMNYIRRDINVVLLIGCKNVEGHNNSIQVTIATVESLAWPRMHSTLTRIQ